MRAMRLGYVLKNINTINGSIVEIIRVTLCDPLKSFALSSNNLYVTNPILKLDMSIFVICNC